MNQTKLNIIQIKNSKKKIKDSVVKELPLTINVDGEELATLLCSPSDLKYLVVGFLFNEGVIQDIKDIENIKINEKYGLASVKLKNKINKKLFQRRVITSGCSGFYKPTDLKLKPIKSHLKIKKEKINELMPDLQKKSKLFLETGGVHSSALCDKDKVVMFFEDIGRHNTIDKIIGGSLVKKIKFSDKIILTSGRLSSEMILKAAKAGVPVVASKSAPTELAVKLAKKLGITLVGFVRGNRVNVYSYDKRII